MHIWTSSTGAHSVDLDEVVAISYGTGVISITLRRGANLTWSFIAGGAPWDYQERQHKELLSAWQRRQAGQDTKQ